MIERISTRSAESPQLAVGTPAQLLIKASVLVGVD